MQDPEDSQSLNRYSYAKNNPLKYVDPTGNEYEERYSGDYSSWGYSLLNSNFTQSGNGSMLSSTSGITNYVISALLGTSEVKSNLDLLLTTPDLPEYYTNYKFRDNRFLSQEERQKVVDVALNNGWLGTPYAMVGDKTVKGKQGDCSGTTWGIFTEAGLPYNYSQADDLGKSPRFSLLIDQTPQPADVGWVPGHVVLYIGDGKFVSASTKQMKLTVTDYYKNKIEKWYGYTKP